MDRLWEFRAAMRAALPRGASMSGRRILVKPLAIHFRMLLRSQAPESHGGASESHGGA